jgi:hypothetical protein
MSRGSGCTEAAQASTCSQTPADYERSCSFYRTVIAQRESFIAHYEAELGAFADGSHAELRYPGREIARLNRELASSRSEIVRFRSDLARVEACPVVEEAPPEPDLVHLQERSLAHSDGLNVVLVTRGTNGRGKPRVELQSHARYPHKLTAVNARELGLALIAGADALNAAPPVAAEGTSGPQETTLAVVADGNVSASLIERGADNRGKRRVSLFLYGARYRYSLDAATARILGLGMVAGADELEAA